MSLIRLDDGNYLNTENLVKFTKLRGDAHKFLDVNGGEHIGTACDPEEKFWPVIPAAAGYVAIFKDEEGYQSTKIVIGWRLCPGGNYAITEGFDCDDAYGYSAIRQPDGSVIDFEGNAFETLVTYRESEALADAA